MGRVYDIKPKPGERGGPGWHCLIDGVRVVGVYRVELDADADAGMATVHALFMNGDSPIMTADKTAAVKVSFRHFVHMVYNGCAAALTPPMNSPKSLWPAALSRAVNPDHLAADPEDPIIVRHA